MGEYLLERQKIRDKSPVEATGRHDMHVDVPTPHVFSSDL